MMHTSILLRDILNCEEMQSNDNPLVVALGKNESGEPVLCDLHRMPHLIIGGAAGSGIAMCIHATICSLLDRASPEQVRLLLIDTDGAGLQDYTECPHLLAPVIDDPRKAARSLSWLVQEMLERYEKFAAQGVRNYNNYNAANRLTGNHMSAIVAIVDDLSSLMEAHRKDLEESVRRLSALARAAGIYLVLVTQHPSRDVLNGVIKNHIPSRIAFSVPTAEDSRIIIDDKGAEKLISPGEMLYKPIGPNVMRIHACLVNEDDKNAIIKHAISHRQANYHAALMSFLSQTRNDTHAYNPIPTNDLSTKQKQFLAMIEGIQGRMAETSDGLEKMNAKRGDITSEDLVRLQSQIDAIREKIEELKECWDSINNSAD